MSWRDPKWQYKDSVETAKPGYLQKRFDEIRRQQERERKATESRVTPIKQKRA